MICDVKKENYRHTVINIHDDWCVISNLQLEGLHKYQEE